MTKLSEKMDESAKRLVGPIADHASKVYGVPWDTAFKLLNVAFSFGAAEMLLEVRKRELDVLRRVRVSEANQGHPGASCGDL